MIAGTLSAPVGLSRPAPNERDNISYSAIAAYRRCPLSYYFKYVAGLPERTVSSSLVFGAAIHRAIEHHFRELLAGGSPPSLEEHVEQCLGDQPLKLQDMANPERHQAHKRFQQADGPALVMSYSYGNLRAEVNPRYNNREDGYGVRQPRTTEPIALPVTGNSPQAIYEALSSRRAESALELRGIRIRRPNLSAGPHPGHDGSRTSAAPVWFAQGRRASAATVPVSPGRDGQRAAVGRHRRRSE
jgi:hypothetical protein